MTAFDAMTHLIDRHDTAPARVRRHLAVMIADAIPALEAEFDAVGDRIVTKRDWLDAHRFDDEKHPRWQERWEQMYFVDTKEHADLGALITRAYEITLSDSSHTQPHPPVCTGWLVDQPTNREWVVRPTAHGAA